MKTSTPRPWVTATILLVVLGILILALSGYLQTAATASIQPAISLQKWISSRYLAVYDLITVPKDVAALRLRNAELENEIASLQTLIIEQEQKLEEADVLYALLDFAREKPENEYIAASVIGKDPSPFLHYVIIDHGSDHGLRHGMPVVTQHGLVGRIDAVMANVARVQLITDPSSTINTYLQAASVDALLKGSLTGDISIEMISQDIEIQTGDLVLSSGLGGGYPQDILIGQIVSIRKLETDLFQSASVQPAVDFNNLWAVLVIKNFRPLDITPLQTTPNP
ncbi:MAG: rod shape-determining protein MreC [Anaerolineaceae bacterium]|nr:rod shape-determining protein MreC [Anaerolineaceae bacterium]